MASRTTRWPAVVVALLLLALLSGGATAQTVAPTNETKTDGDAAVVVMALLRAAGDSSSSAASTILLALTKAAADDIPDAGLNGTIRPLNADNYLSAPTDSIALISCDAYPGFLQPSDVFGSVIASNATAVVLYSETSQSCLAPDVPSGYAWVYTTRNSTTGLLNAIRNLSGGDAPPPYAMIARRDVLSGSGGGSNSGFVGNDTASNAGSQAQNSLGASPSTAVAMIILYSITGIITALFLIIIMAGAVRAHRHPERYGPRNVVGRPRQSRARGIARAMLETIPIVKFGERTEEVQKPADVELADQHGQAEALPAPEPAHTRAATPEAVPRDAAPPVAPADDDTNGIAAAIPTAPPQSPTVAADHHHHHQGCSICTDDFELGQDQRVLPCDHRFHPACIDPWLLNVSGTCPLCRIDLRPRDPDAPAYASPDAALPPPLAAPHDRRRRSVVLALMGLPRPERMTREARVDALRRLRAGAGAGAGAGAVEHEPADEGRTRGRVWNAFRVRTRRTGEQEEEEEQQDDGVLDPRRTGTFAGPAGRA